MRNNILIAFEKFIEGFDEIDEADGQQFLEHKETYFKLNINGGIVEIESVFHGEDEDEIDLSYALKAEIEIELEKMLEREIDKPTGQKDDYYNNGVKPEDFI